MFPLSVCPAQTCRVPAIDPFVEDVGMTVVVVGVVTDPIDSVDLMVVPSDDGTAVVSLSVVSLPVVSVTVVVVSADDTSVIELLLVAVLGVVELSVVGSMVVVLGVVRGRVELSVVGWMVVVAMLALEVTEVPGNNVVVSAAEDVPMVVSLTSVTPPVTDHENCRWEE